MKHYLTTALLILLAGLQVPAHAASPQEQKAAMQIITHYTGTRTPAVKMGSLPAENGCPVYSYSVKDEVLYLKGSNGVALCKGYYDFLRAQGKGNFSWSSKRSPKNIDMRDTARETKCVSPVPHHYYFNVVTYGYSLVYWDWKRWEKEISWMALHGVDMPLALVANEAISARVFKRLGLSDEEIASYFVGPAHLPWMRMGNISGIDGPMPQEWHKDQIALQHKILDKMRSLGMTPVCPGFAGFVPPALKKIYPNANIVQTSWCGGKFHNWMLMPDQELFTKIGSMFIQEWEKEFGKCSHYIVDSFNEMEVPFPPHGSKERYELLATYGDKVYSAIRNASPDAVWVMQGWMFGYQRNIWDERTLAALLSKVPDDKMLLLDLAVDYNRHFWDNGSNWDKHKGYYNKGWVYSVVPNMGGKCGLTGVLDFYANGHLDALNSPNKGRMMGIGMAPEGIENNEVIYELMTDAGWRSKKVDLTKWLKNYNRCRYGKNLPELDAYWEEMRKASYGSFTDHPRYNWQFRPGGSGAGSINANEHFYRAIESFAAAAPKLKGSHAYRYDLMELTAAYLGGKVEILIQASAREMQLGDMEKAKEYEAQIEKYMLAMDKLLCSHPVQRLENWLEYARAKGNTPELKDYYEKNARRIVTIWGPPVDDYSARIWSGLIRDYYLPRRQQYLKGKLTPGKRVDMAKWEREWVEQKRGLSPQEPYDDCVAAARALIKESSKINKSILAPTVGKPVGSWSPADVSCDWQELSWSVSPADVKNAKALVFTFTHGNNRLEIDRVQVEMDGVIVADVRQNGIAGVPSRNNVYRLQIPADAQGNNSCRIIATVRSDGQANSNGTVSLSPRK